MSVRIRMKKMGRTHRPFYRICVMDSRKPRDGKAIEEVGTYDPMVRDKSKRVTLKLDRIDYWVSVGAQPTEKVGVLIRKYRDNDWGTAKEAPAMAAPKPLPEEKPAESEASGEEASGDAAGTDSSTEQ